MRAHIFDLDGTLLDSMDVWDSINTTFFNKRGIEMPADYPSAVLRMSLFESAEYTIKRFALPDGAAVLMREWNDMAAYAYRHSVAMKPYAKEYLYLLRERGVKLGVATSLPAGLYASALDAHGIRGLFCVISDADAAGHGKSRPDIFVLAADKLGVKPGECVVYEDILAAVVSAKQIGMTVIGVYDKTSEADWEQIKKTADHTVRDFKDLCDRVKNADPNITMVLF